MEETNQTTISNSTNNVSKCAKDSLINSTYKSSFSNSTNRTTLSIDEIQSRRSEFEKFITSLPKICSPTICGTLNFKTPNSKLFESVCSSKVNNKSEGTSGYQTSSLNKVEENSTKCDSNSQITDSTSCQIVKNDESETKVIVFKNPFEEKLNRLLDESSNDNKSDSAKLKNEDDEESNQFDWSIDQIALLNPCDITFDDNFLIYKEFEELNRSILNKESEEFFKQNQIAPSPMINTPVLTRKRLLQNMCKTGSPFIDYLNSKKKSMFKTPLQLSSIKSLNSDNCQQNQLIRTPHQHTPINELSILNEKNLPKKKLFYKFESSSTKKSKNYSNCSTNQDDFSQLNNNQLDCTGLDCNRFELDLSAIGNEINLNESNHMIKFSTNLKEPKQRLIEDLLEEDENEIKELNLNDSIEEINEIKNVNEHKNLIQNEIKENEDDLQMMSFSIQKSSDEVQVTSQSLMDCSFQTAKDFKDNVSINQINNVNQLLINQNDELNKASCIDQNNQINQMINQKDKPISDVNLELEDNQSMETSEMICSIDLNNFNDDRIDPTFCKNQHLTSTPFLNKI